MPHGFSHSLGASGLPLKIRMANTPAATVPTRESPEDAPELPEDFSGRVLGDFELIRRIGIGGMGQVYLARQRSLKRQVAIKILKGELAANTTALRRFQAEAEAVANITHAHIVQVYAIGEDQKLHYMALEYVDGRNLRDHLEKKGIPELRLALDIMRQVASALERAGELGFVHRDIKPENILFSRKGEVKVTDFGLSRCFGNDTPLNLTQSGVAMGTPLYMSPEQVRGQVADPRSDIYSFGVTCYHMLAGEPPFRGTSAFDIAIQHVQAEPPPLVSVRPDLPPELCAIVHRMMAKRPEQRYQSAREIINDLARVREDTGLPAPPLPGGVSVFIPATGFSSTNVPATNASGFTIQPLSPPASGAWRFVVVALLAVAAAVGGAAWHWSQNSRVVVTTPNPDNALTDIDPAPSVLRENELKRQLNDKAVRIEVALDDLLELSEIYIGEHKFDDALKLFDLEALRKLGALELSTKEIRDREQIPILSGLGKAVVLAYQDRADDSNAEFLRIVKTHPPLLKVDPMPRPKDVKSLARGQLEVFFNRPVAGVNWKRAVGEAIDRNAKNLNAKVPDDLKRLLILPAKRPVPKG